MLSVEDEDSKSGRRLITITAMFLGALIGAILVLHVQIVLPLALALAITMLVAVGSYVAGRSDPEWTRVEG